MHLSRKAIYPFRYQYIECGLYMFGYRHGKEAERAADGKAEAVCAELELFNADGFPKLFI